jgi:hypothetical protein
MAFVELVRLVNEIWILMDIRNVVMSGNVNIKHVTYDLLSMCKHTTKHKSNHY